MEKRQTWLCHLWGVEFGSCVQQEKGDREAVCDQEIGTGWHCGDCMYVCAKCGRRPTLSGSIQRNNSQPTGAGRGGPRMG